MFLIKGEDTKKRVENLVDQLGSFGANISPPRRNVENMWLQLGGERELPKWLLDVYPSTSANFTAGKRRGVLEWLSIVKSGDHHAEVVKAHLDGTGTRCYKEMRYWSGLNQGIRLFCGFMGKVIQSTSVRQSKG